MFFFFLISHMVFPLKIFTRPFGFDMEFEGIPMMFIYLLIVLRECPFVIYQQYKEIFFSL